jgi:hypothetical protein
VPTVTLFGPESIGEWHFYPKDKHRTLQIPVLCRNEHPARPEYAWCGAATCPLGSHACMNLIHPEAVAKEVCSLL